MNILLQERSEDFKVEGKRPHTVMEEELHHWILACNVKRLRVKDLYVFKMTLKIIERTRNIDNISILSVDIPEFKASSGWLEWFKKCNNLESHRYTIDCKLPDCAFEVSKAFIQDCREVIDTQKIKTKNIINMDHVP